MSVAGWHKAALKSIGWVNLGARHGGTEPSAVALNARVKLSIDGLSDPKALVAEVCAGIRRYRTRFCTEPLRALKFQNTLRCCTFPLVARANLTSTSASPETNDVTCTPTSGPCLNPWPEPPPTSQTFSN